MGSEGRDSFKGFIGRKRAKQQKKKKGSGRKTAIVGGGTKWLLSAEANRELRPLEKWFDI